MVSRLVLNSQFFREKLSEYISASDFQNIKICDGTKRGKVVLWERKNKGQAKSFRDLVSGGYFNFAEQLFLSNKFTNEELDETYYIVFRSNHNLSHEVLEYMEKYSLLSLDRRNQILCDSIYSDPSSTVAKYILEKYPSNDLSIRALSSSIIYSTCREDFLYYFEKYRNLLTDDNILRCSITNNNVITFSELIKYYPKYDYSIILRLPITSISKVLNLAMENNLLDPILVKDKFLSIVEENFRSVVRDEVAVSMLKYIMKSKTIPNEDYLNIFIKSAATGHSRIVEVLFPKVSRNDAVKVMNVATNIQVVKKLRYILRNY